MGVAPRCWQKILNPEFFIDTIRHLKPLMVSTTLFGKTQIVVRTLRIHGPFSHWGPSNFLLICLKTQIIFVAFYTPL